MMYIFYTSILILVWYSIKPSNDRNWSIDQAILPHAHLDDTKITVFNVRNFNYKSVKDYTPRYYNKVYNLDELVALYYCIEPFPGIPGSAHTFLSFAFKNGEHLAVSVEIRKRKDTTFSAWKSLFKGFEIMYVLGDEKDVVKLRTKHRKDQVYIYPLKYKPENIKTIFRDVINRTNKLYHQPEFYNTIFNNCTTNIFTHLNVVMKQRIHYSYRILLPKFSDKLLYKLGLIDTKLPFEKIRKYFNINKKAKKYENSSDFPLKIRNGLK